MEHPLIAKFNKDFRAYLNAAITFASIQEPYQALDIEDEIRWIESWLRGNANAKEHVMSDESLYISSPSLPT